MIVNGIDIIKKYNLIVTEREFQANKIISYTDWLDNSISPIRVKTEDEDYSSLCVEFLVEGNNEQEVLMKISNIINDCKSGFLRFGDTDFSYNFTLEDHKSKLIYDRAYKLILTLKTDYKLLDEVTENINRVLSKTINVKGNADTPCIVEIIPSIDTIDLVINGLSDDPITIKNLKAGQKIIINGEDGTVLQNGANKFGDTDMWEFPRLKPRANTITVSRNNVDITVRYKPRYI